MKARIEIHPVKLSPSHWKNRLPLHERPHFVRLVAANGEVLGHSEVYETKANAVRAAGDWQDAMLQVTEQGDRGIVVVQETKP